MASSLKQPRSCRRRLSQKLSRYCNIIFAELSYSLNMCLMWCKNVRWVIVILLAYLVLILDGFCEACRIASLYLVPCTCIPFIVKIKVNCKWWMCRVTNKSKLTDSSPKILTKLKLLISSFHLFVSQGMSRKSSLTLY